MLNRMSGGMTSLKNTDDLFSINMFWVTAATLVTAVTAHGTVVSPRSRNSVDYLVGVNSPKDWPSNAE